MQAEALLAKALQLEAGLPMARRGLVTAYVRQGRLDKAMSALPVDVERNDRDPGMMALAGQVYMLHGDVDRAQRYFARASALILKTPQSAHRWRSAAWHRVRGMLRWVSCRALRPRMTGWWQTWP